MPSQFPNVQAPLRGGAFRPRPRIRRPGHPLAPLLRQAAVVVGLLLPVAAIQLPAAQAQSTRFALACVGTETGYTVQFSYRWGTSGEWKSSSVAPGKWIKLMWNYDRPGENRSPKLAVRYDDDATNAYHLVNTDLQAYAASTSDCEKQGKTYNFYQRGNELYIRSED